MSDPATPTIEILPDQRSLRIGGAEQPIGARAFDLLVYLHANSGGVVSKAELLENVWADLTVEESSLTAQIAALRKLLGPRAIATVPGVGYQLTLSPTTPPLKSEALPLPDKPSLAVLPFANLTGDPGKDYLVDGIVAELIAALTRIPAFFVISASSTFTLKGQSLDLADVGRRLGVRYILEGSILQAGERLRINTQLVEAETGHTIGSDRFTGAMADIFELQDEVTAHVAAAIEPNVLYAESRRADARPPTDLNAYDLCLRATPAAIRLYSLQDYRVAKDLLTRALALDPGYVHAKALLCQLCIGARASRFITFEEAREVLPLAEEILTNDKSTDSLTLANAGFAVAYLGGQPERGIRILNRAEALNPKSFYVLAIAGWAHCYVADLTRAESLFLRALRLNPLDPNIGALRSGLGWIMHQQGRLGDAIEMLTIALKEDPEFASAHIYLMVSLWKAGRIDEARHQFDILRAKDTRLTVSGFLHRTPYKSSDWRHDVVGALRSFGVPEWSEQLPVDPQPVDGAAVCLAPSLGRQILFWALSLRARDATDPCDDGGGHLGDVREADFGMTSDGNVGHATISSQLGFLCTQTAAAQGLSS